MSPSTTPTRTIALTLGVFVVLWTLFPALLHTAMPIDVVESGTWGREGTAVSYKHPNLPGLLIEVAYRLTGQYGWPQYLLSALAAALAIRLIYALGRDMFGDAAGAAGAVLLTGCYYFTWPVVEFNHNIAQLPVWAAIALLLWRAAARNVPWYWLLLGLVAGIGLFAKLSTASIIVSGGLWLLIDARARGRLGGIWPWAGLAVFLALALPLGWLIATGNGGLLSFIALSGSYGVGPLHFALAQLLDLLPLLVVLGVAILLPRRRGESVVATPIELWRVRRYLAIMLGGPFVVALISALVTGAEEMWGTPMLNLIGLLVVAMWPGQFDAAAIRRIGVAGLTLVVLAPTSYALGLALNANLSATPLRTQWPQRDIATRFNELWQHQTEAPLAIVGGYERVAGLIALGIEPRASIYSSLSQKRSPWISDERVRQQGMLVVWTSDEVPDYAAPLLAGHANGSEHFTWSSSPAAKPIVVWYVVVPPVKAN